MFVIIGELGNCFIMSSGHHSGWSLLGSEFLDMSRLVGSIRWKAADHLFVLSNSDTFALQDLNVLESRENLVLDNEDSLHLIPTAFLDCEWLVLESFECTWSGQINGDVWSAFNFLESCQFATSRFLKQAYQSKRLDDACSGIIWVANGGTGT